MNERIRQLLKQAELDVILNQHASEYGNGYMENTPYPEIEKFAELIVLELCRMMEQCQNDCDTGDASETNWGYISQLQDWIDRFKRHFGVQ